MRSQEQRLSSERVTLRTAILVLSLGIVGVLLIAFAIGAPWPGKLRIIQVLIEQLGGFLFVTATITVMWELAAKRAFLDEILVKTQVARDVALAGLLKITNQFLDDIDWRQHIEESSKIDICFAYAQTWRGAHGEQLKTSMRDNEARIRIILPDPENGTVVSALSQRFGYTEEEVKTRIHDCIDFVKTLKEEEKKGRGHIRLWLLQKSPVFSCYRFDSLGVLALYKHQKGRGNVPTFLFRRGGVLYDFMRQEFDAMTCDTDGLTKEMDLTTG